MKLLSRLCGYEIRQTRKEQIDLYIRCYLKETYQARLDYMVIT